MRTLATLLATIAPATAFAASSAHEDNSGFFVWIFLGFCALIVAAQVVPAALMFFGLMKGIASKPAEKVELKS